MDRQSCRRTHVTHAVTDALTGRIEERTKGEVRNLRVEMHEDRLIVHGHCSAPHIRGVALAALWSFDTRLTIEVDGLKVA